MGKALIAFYSRADENYLNGRIQKLKTGNTEVAAGILQKLTGADLFRIEQEQPYPEDYNECIEQARRDQEKAARPELSEWPESISGYDVIYLGYPNYWSTMPMAVFTFLEHCDFGGKTIKPFCTHEGSGMGRSLRDIKKLCPTAEVEDGLAIRGGDAKNAEDVFREWI